MRCFVALRPDDLARDQLDALTADWQQRFPVARRMRRDNLHLTLAFIGEIDAAIAHRIASRLAKQLWQRGTWYVDRIGVFRKARVLWAGSEVEAQLASMSAAVRTLLDEMQVRYDRKPFVPHVTLLRNLTHSTLGATPVIDPPITWPITSPALLYSTQVEIGTRYVALEPCA